MRNIKIFGLAVVAALAMTSVASAAELTAEAYPATLTGGPDPGAAADVLVSTVGNISCTNPKYSATLNAASTTVTVTPNYGETSEKQCTAFGFPATVHMNGCTYLFHIPAGVTKEATVDLICPAGQEVTMTSNPSEHGLTPKCTVHFKEQKGLGEITITNVGTLATREITLDVNLKNIHYTHTKGTGLGACTEGTGNTGSITGKVTYTGKNAGGAHVGIFLS